MPNGENASNDSSTTIFRGSAAKPVGSSSTYLFQADEPMTPCHQPDWCIANWSKQVTPLCDQAAALANHCGHAAAWLTTLGRQTCAEVAARGGYNGILSVPFLQRVVQCRTRWALAHFLEGLTENAAVVHARANHLRLWDCHETQDLGSSRATVSARQHGGHQLARAIKRPLLCQWQALLRR
jgi:hypothetical protein